MDGNVLSLSDPEVSEQSLSTSTFRMVKGGEQAPLKVHVPRATVLFDGFDVTNVPSPGLIVPPSALPAHAVPVSARLVLAGASDPATVRAVLDRIGAIAPTADVDPAGINIGVLALAMAGTWPLIGRRIDPERLTGRRIDSP